MADVRSMIQEFERNQWVILEQARGLDNADTLLQLPFRGNCFNWVVGHIVAHRDKMLVALGKDPILDEDEAQVYARGSEPVTGMQTAVSSPVPPSSFVFFLFFAFREAFVFG